MWFDVQLPTANDAELLFIRTWQPYTFAETLLQMPALCFILCFDLLSRVAQASFKLCSQGLETDPPASASHILGLRVCATMPSFYCCYF